MLKRLALAVLILASAAPAFSQGAQTGTISGSVRSTDTQPLPGVTVTATAPELQGERLAITDANGVYFLRGLPAGTYRLDFTLPAFGPAQRPAVQARGGAAVDLAPLLPVARLPPQPPPTASPPPPPAPARPSPTYPPTHPP